MSGFNVSNVRYMSSVFETEPSLMTNVGITDWYVRNVVDMSNIFQYASAWNDDSRRWESEKVETLQVYSFPNFLMHFATKSAIHFSNNKIVNPSPQYPFMKLHCLIDKSRAGPYELIYISLKWYVTKLSVRKLALAPQY